MESTNRRGLLIVFLVVVVDLLGFGIVLPLLPRFGSRLNATDFTVGLLTGVFSLMQFVFSPWWGRLSDRVGRRPVLLIGLAGSAFFYVLFAFACYADSLILLFVSRIGAGIAGATISTAQAYIADSTPPEKRTGGMAIIGAAFGIGFTFGPLLGAVALMNSAATEAGPAPLPALPGILAAGLSTLALLLAVFLLRESLGKGERTKAGHSRFDLDAWRIAATTPLAPALILSFFASTFAFAQFESTLSPVTERVYHIKDKDMYYIFFYCGVTLVLAQGFLVRRLARTVADERLAVGGVALMLLGVGLGMPALASGELKYLLAVIPVLVVGFAFTNPSLQSMVSKRTPADRQGAVLGVNQSAAALARVLGPIVSLPLLGKQLFLPYALSASLMMLVLAILYLRVLPGAVAPAAAGVAPTAETTAG